MKETDKTLLDQNKTARDFLRASGQIRLDEDYLVTLMESYATAKAQASCEATLETTAKNVRHHKGYFDTGIITDPSNITIV